MTFFPLEVHVTVPVLGITFDETLHQSVLGEAQSDSYVFLCSNFSCGIPMAPVMTVVPLITAVSVTVVKVPGYYAAGEYCISVVERNDERCFRDVSATNYSGLSAYTNYTVLGWIINSNGLIGGKTTQTVSTLTDSKFSSSLKACHGEDL